MQALQAQFAARDLNRDGLLDVEELGLDMAAPASATVRQRGCRKSRSRRRVRRKEC